MPVELEEAFRDLEMTIWLLSLCYGAFWSAVCYLAAKARDRNPRKWAFIGFFFGLFAAVALVIIGKGEDQKGI